ncbi:MAG: hypothetical protein E6I35_03280 [Chloroflexi bacterium]|nr:MAG: hypothetical protein E6I35_03280 [Chloroflexota bacterium]
MRIRLGTRGSMLALAQSDWVAGRLRSAGHDVEVARIVTEGDLRPVDTVPGEGIFVAAIANALKSGEIDVAVHSAKDVPLEEESDLVIAARAATCASFRCTATSTPGSAVSTRARSMRW